MSEDRPIYAGESVQRIEPARLEHPPESVADLAAELSAASARLGRSLHPRTAANLTDLVRMMNTYYSNLIEGHNTRPRDIERALAGEFDGDEARRNLQLEAAGHVRVQAAVDRMGATGTLPEPASPDFLRWLHREFYRDAPDAMLRIEGVGRVVIMTPGEWRSRQEQDVAVGRHQPRPARVSTNSCSTLRSDIDSKAWAAPAGSSPWLRHTIASTTCIHFRTAMDGSAGS